MNATSTFTFPVFRNGEGQATEVLMINTDQSAHEGSVVINNSEGESQSIILR